MWLFSTITYFRKVGDNPIRTEFCEEGTGLPLRRDVESISVLTLISDSALSVQRRTDEIEAVLPGESADFCDLRFGRSLGRNGP